MSEQMTEEMRAALARRSELKAEFAEAQSKVEALRAAVEAHDANMIANNQILSDHMMKW
ncbi:hypothetical protein ACXYMP_05765 [Aliiroseovarius sp. CAU 1755]